MRKINESNKRPQRIDRPPIFLNEFAQKNKNILIVRAVSGLGDIFMHRMMFKNFKDIMPDVKIHFACFEGYAPAVQDHPYIDEVIPVKMAKARPEINQLLEEFRSTNKFWRIHDTCTACQEYEEKKSPFADLHRSDIWAKECGIKLTDHDMHVRFSEEELKWGKNRIEETRVKDGPIICIAPISSTQNKDISPENMVGLINGLRERGYKNMFGLHSSPIKTLLQNDVPCINNLSIREWMSVINASDYVISVDTSTYHCAGGLKKPLVGMFTWADGVVYGQYFDFCLVQRHRNTDPNWTCGPCYCWHACPKTKQHLKPCVTEITSEMILEQVDKMFEKWPNLGR